MPCVQIKQDYFNSGDVEHCSLRTLQYLLFMGTALCYVVNHCCAKLSVNIRRASVHITVCSQSYIQHVAEKLLHYVTKDRTKFMLQRRGLYHTALGTVIFGTTCVLVITVQDNTNLGES